MREIKVEFETSSRPQKYNRLPRVIAKEDRDFPMQKNKTVNTTVFNFL